MKKLGKLNLTSEKMLSYEELVSFRGGSGNPFGDVCTNWDCAICMGTCIGDCAVNFEGDPPGQASCETWCSQYCPVGA